MFLRIHLKLFLITFPKNCGKYSGNANRPIISYEVVGLFLHKLHITYNKMRLRKIHSSDFFIKIGGIMLLLFNIS